MHSLGGGAQQEDVVTGCLPLKDVSGPSLSHPGPIPSAMMRMSLTHVPTTNLFFQVHAYTHTHTYITSPFFCFVFYETELGLVAMASLELTIY